MPDAPTYDQLAELSRVLKVTCQPQKPEVAGKIVCGYFLRLLELVKGRWSPDGTEAGALDEVLSLYKQWTRTGVKPPENNWMNTCTKAYSARCGTRHPAAQVVHLSAFLQTDYSADSDYMADLADATRRTLRVAAMEVQQQLLRESTEEATMTIPSVTLDF